VDYLSGGQLGVLTIMNRRANDDITIQEISETPEELESDSAFEFILVIEDPSPDGSLRLSDELKLISGHLEEDIQSRKELEELEGAFLRLSKVLSPHQQQSCQRHFNTKYVNCQMLGHNKLP
jgi:hypothetical protein